MVTAAILAQLLTAASGGSSWTTEVVAPAVSCESLQKSNLSRQVGASVHVIAAETVRDGASSECAVRGLIAPQTHFEVRLPLSNWSGRFVQTGCGGLCGLLAIRLGNAEGCLPAQRGELVLASTDMGHSGGMTDASWARDDYTARVDFAYRSVHLTTLTAKALIKQYYGRNPRRSYFVGCSDGGREALMEAQRFPRDFDGITAGASAMAFTVQATFFHAWNVRVNADSTGRAILTADKLPILHAAVMSQCDAADGVKDGLISDPLNCHPDLSGLQCQSTQDPTTCLTAEQLHVIREIYSGAHDSEGHKFVISGPPPGSELDWSGVYVPRQPQDRSWGWDISEGVIKYVVSDPNPPDGFTLNDFQFDQQSFGAVTKLHGLYDATDPDLSVFAAAGGKLILWHGLADPHISPLYSIAYYEAVRRGMGSKRADSFARLFLFPGGGHCFGGEGPMDVDLLTPMMSWVESGKAPEVLVAAHSVRPAGPMPPTPGTGKVDRTRPIYAYPMIARYKGSGSIDEAANFEPSQPVTATPSVIDWEGAGFYTPHYELWCGAADKARPCRRAQQGE